MAVTYEVFTGSLGTSTGNRDITHATETAVPKGAIVVISGQAGDAGVQNNAGIHVLYVDENDDFAGESTNSRNSRPTVEAHRRINTVGNNFVGLDPNGDPATDFSISSATLIAGGVRLNFGTAPSASWNCFVLAFFGADCTTKLRSGTLPSAGSTNFEHAVGTPTEALLCSSTDGSTDANSVHAGLGVGMFADAIDRCIRWGEEDGAGSGQPYGRIETTIGHVNIFNANTFGTHALASQANGWTVSDAGGGASNSATMFSLNVNGLNVYCGFANSPTSTGVQSIESPGFEPAAVLMVMSLMDSVQENREDGNAGGLAIAAFTADAIAAASINVEDGSGTTDTQSRFSSASARLDQHDGSAGLEFTLDSFDSLGFNLNWSAVLASGRGFIYLAFEEDSGSGSVTVTPAAATATFTATDPTVAEGSIAVTPGLGHVHSHRPRGGRRLGRRHPGGRERDLHCDGPDRGRGRPGRDPASGHRDVHRHRPCRRPGTGDSHAGRGRGHLHRHGPRRRARQL